ncbi:MAG TPA: hypothetical protein VGK43_04890, partial [Solirubrobacterales bacterium]
IVSLADRGSIASRSLLVDPRIHLFTADGRRWLLARPEPYDVIVVDVVRPTSAYSGNLYSVEFYELVASRLAEDGVFVQWIASERVLNSVRKVFRHVAIGEVPDYFSSRFVIASKSPLRLHLPTLRQRLNNVDLEASFDPGQRQRLIEFFESGKLRRVWQSRKVADLPEERFNRDLHPRDEYFLNE